MILVLSGPPASGKSLAGDLLATHTGAAHLEMDEFRVRLLPEAPHTRETRIVAYRAMLYAGQLLAARGHDVILNASYAHDSDRVQVEQAAVAGAWPLFLVEFRVPAGIAIERCRARRAVHPGADLTDERVLELVTRFPYTHAGIVVDGTAPPETILARIQAYLAARRPLAPGAWINSNRPSGSSR